MSGTTPSGTIASPGSGEPQGHSATGSPLRRAGLTTPATVIIAVAALLALALRLYQLSRPVFLLSVNEYDDGPYFGSAVRLVNGDLPYRDFLIVQPPGITLLMVPVALVSKATGTAWGMAIGRILTALAGAVAVALAGLLVRHRGALATVIVCGIATNICCFFAARDLKLAGFEIWMIEDASAGIDVPAAGLYQAKAKEEGQSLGIRYATVKEVKFD